MPGLGGQVIVMMLKACPHVARHEPDTLHLAHPCLGLGAVQHPVGPGPAESPARQHVDRSHGQGE
jgi:hypothetical protein